MRSAASEAASCFPKSTGIDLFKREGCWKGRALSLPSRRWLRRAPIEGSERSIPHGLGMSQADPAVGGLMAISAALSRTRRYPEAGGKTNEDMRLRLMRVLFGDDIPDPREIAIISLSQAVDLFESLVSAQEPQLARERIDLLCRMDQIGRTVAQTVRVYQSSEAEAALPARQIPKVPGFPLLGSILEVSRGAPASFGKYCQRLVPVYQVRLLRKQYTVLGTGTQPSSSSAAFRRQYSSFDATSRGGP